MQITELKKMVQQREILLNQKLEAARTEADRELWELRRQLSKAHDSHVEILEQIERKHADELGSYKRFYFSVPYLPPEIKIIVLILEQCQLMNGGSRVALEQLYDEKLQTVETQHQSQLSKNLFSTTISLEYFTFLLL